MEEIKFYEELAEFMVKLKKFQADHSGTYFGLETAYGKIERHHLGETSGSAIDELSDLQFCIEHFYNIEPV